MAALMEDGLLAAMTAVRERFDQQEKRIVNLEQQVANHALSLKTIADSNLRKNQDEALKSQAAQQQAENHLYAPLRNDTRAVIDMAAFVRKVAGLYKPDSIVASNTIDDLIVEAQQILKRST